MRSSGGLGRFSLHLIAGTLALLSPSQLWAQGLADPPNAGVLTAEPTAAPAPIAVATPTPAPPPRPVPPSPPISAVVGVRSLVYLQNPNAPKQLDDVGMTGEVNLNLSGKVHPFLRWQAAFAGALGAPGATSAVLLDLVAKLEFADALNIWIGRMPIPSDRTSLSTAWAITPWTLPGRYGSVSPFAAAGSRPAAGPRYGELGRGDGLTLWGQLGGGRLKYYAGMFGLDQPEASPLCSARLALSLLGPEPGFRASSGYFGGKDLLAIGVGAQHRSKGSLPPAGGATPPDDYDAVSADVLFEMGSESSGVLDLEGAFARLWGANEIVDYQVFGLVSYLVPLDVGIGRFQPLFRVQHAGSGSAADAGAFTCIDAQLGYIVDGYNARLSTNYQYTRMAGQVQNAVLFGVQLLSKAK